MILGDARYASPDQFGRDEPNPSWDVYSLGATAFFALAGQPPFLGETDVSVMMEQLKSPTPTLIGLVEDVPAEVEVAVTRAMDRDPRKRWPSAGAFAAAMCKGAGIEAPKTVDYIRPTRRASVDPRGGAALLWAGRVAVLAAVLFGAAWLAMQMRS
jgi:serine/threonine-protein kinase